MSTVTLQEAEERLGEIIAGLQAGEELLIVRDDEPIARLVGEKARTEQPRVAGRQKDQILFMADDFNAPLQDFREYME